jgi:hypothetical protein
MKTASNGRKLPDRTYQALKEIGFDFTWNALETRWYEKFEELKAYQEQHGHCNVPYKSSLFGWISDQRDLFKKEKLPLQRVQLLDSINFDWEPFTSEWGKRFKELGAFQKHHGHCNAPGNSGLGTWVGNQRSAYKKGRLSAERIQRLTAIGFDWDGPETALWERRFSELEAYEKQYGDCNVPATWAMNRALGQWVAAQRGTYRNRTLPEAERLARRIGLLSDEQIERLNKLGFVWEPLSTTWENNFAKLKAFRDKHGHCNVPKRWEDPSLGQWLLHLRKNYEARALSEAERLARQLGTLSDDQIRRLEEIGFVWDPYAVAWDAKFENLKAYRKKHGHCNIPQKSKGNPGLGAWVANQRNHYRRGELPKERIQRLNEIGFKWDLQDFDAAWETQFVALRTYQEEQGDCNIPQRWEENPTLARWTNTQRQRRKKGLLDAEQIQRLEEIGFIWNPIEVALEVQFSALEDYQYRFGNCNVPATWEEDPSLGAWVTTRRTDYRAGRLPDEQVQRLNKMGFDWDPFKTVWETRFAELKAYQEKHGHCRFPVENSVLGKWVSHQRDDYKTNKLSAERIRRLEEISFEWDPSTTLWDTRLAELKAYRKQHGHCDVPLRWAGNPGLGNWVISQRVKRGSLSEERIRRLEEIGFEWAQREKETQLLWDTRFAELRAYRKQHGDCNVPKRWEENPTLGQWVSNQRSNRKTGNLNPQRISLLNGLGFCWSLSRNL